MLVGDGVEDLADRGAETDTPLTEQERKHGGRENVSFDSKQICKLEMFLNLCLQGSLFPQEGALPHTAALFC